MKTILLIEGNVIVRRAIAKIIRDKTNYSLIVHGDLTTAVESIEQIKPDLLLLGMHPEKVEEVALLSTIRTRFRELPLITLSPRTEEGAALAIAGLRLGTIDFVTKPQDCNTMLFADQHMLKRLLPVMNALLKPKPHLSSDLAELFRITKKNELFSLWPLNLIVIGGCTGGPVALFNLFELLPEHFNIPIVIVQHLPKYYTGVLAARLDENTELTVKEARGGAALQPGTAWIAPGGYHTEVYRSGSQTRLKVHRGPREHGERPSIDKLFVSAARLYGPGVTGVVLSGCGQDGVAGSEAVRQAGGQVVVQDYQSAILPNLPLAVIKEGHCDFISSINDLPNVLSIRDKYNTRDIRDTEKNESRNDEKVSIAGYKYFRSRERHLFSTSP